MTYITGSQDRPIHGVSQQPDKVRLKGQCSASDNMTPDVVQGLKTRAGTKHNGYLSNASLANNTKWHQYDRDGIEEYIMSVETDGSLSVWDLEGVPQIVNVQDNTEAGYLASPDPKNALKMLTIGDFTFIVNTEREVEASSTLTNPVDHEALVYVQFMDYAQSITITLDGVLVATFNSARGDNVDDIYSVAVNYIIDKLVLALNGGSGSGTTDSWSGIDISGTYNISSTDRTILLSRKNGADFTIVVGDDASNKNSVAIKGKLEDTTLLPSRAPIGFKVEIDPPGSDSGTNSNFWLIAEAGAGDHITWKESIAPDISVGLNKATMPHVLVRESITLGVATFTLRQGEWADREVGNELVNPQPSFIDEDNPVTLKSIGIFQNRLFLTSGENTSMTRSSGTDNFFNFYRESAQVALDTDPIDVYADTDQVNNLEASVAFDGDLVFFSKGGQFTLSGAEPRTPNNSTIRQATSFESQLAVDPVASGDSVFFAFRYGNFTGIREFFVDSTLDTKRARPITDHVKRYLVGDPVLMKTSTDLNLLIVKTDNDDNILYIYDWIWQGSEKVQSAWGRFVFEEDANILHFQFIDEILWIVVARDGDKVAIESYDVSDLADDILTYSVRVDRKQEIIMTQTSGIYRFTDPLPDIDIDNIIVVQASGALEGDEGTVIEVERDGADLVAVDDTLGTDPITVIVGVAYDWLYTPTNPVALDEQGNALNLDRLTVGAFYMNYDQTGNITAEVEDLYGNIRKQEFGNRTLGGPENLVGFSPIFAGQHRVTVRKKSDSYTLSYKGRSHLPLVVRDFEFNGNLNRRGRRI